MADDTKGSGAAPARPGQAEAEAVVAAFVGLMRGYTLRIANGRSLADVREALRDETRELDDELALLPRGVQGPDGVTGESVDVALCGIDLALLTDGGDDLATARLILAKSDKWETLYAHSVSRDRSGTTTSGK